MESSIKLMTWATYKKKFKPEIWCVPDFIGSRTIVKPTMTQGGFRNTEIYDIDPNEKPTEIVLRECNSLSKYIDVNFPVVYYKWTYRDFSGYAITMFYKTAINNAKNLNKMIRCERCKEILNPNKVKWLELSETDGNYYETIPKGHKSQGAFSFGTACATTQIKETINKIKNAKDNR